ncbi:hypothetical protein MRB53_040452 [Persea americana]|nr:hypothetical protein MRB53_040452 [Persea americana]
MPHPKTSSLQDPSVAVQSSHTKCNTANGDALQRPALSTTLLAVWLAVLFTAMGRISKRKAAAASFPDSTSAQKRRAPTALVLDASSAECNVTTATTVAPTMSKLGSLPNEILAQIACHLPVMTLLDFAKASKHFAVLIENRETGGNLIWHAAAPPAIFTKLARHLIMQPPNARRVYSPIGSMYESSIDYQTALKKAQAVKGMEQCVACLSTRNGTDHLINIKMWGKSWCTSCFEEYTISERCFSQGLARHLTISSYRGCEISSRWKGHSQPV